MDILRSDVKGLNAPAYNAEPRIYPAPGWLLGRALEEEGEIPAPYGQIITDPKVEQIFQLYARQNIPAEIRRARRVLLAWQIHTFFQKKMKRAFDLALALTGLPFVFPVMVITAIAIKLDSPGPVIFRQERVGKWGRHFTCYKFRSMRVNAEAWKAELSGLNEADEVVFKIKRDPRITRVGRIIRKLSIDELPQIFNIFKGDMSVVGPRPPLPVEVETYPFDTYRRLDTVPGLTGLQQVSGRSDLPFKRWVELDVEYIREQSVKKDVEILVKTIPAVITGKGAY